MVRIVGIVLAAAFGASAMLLAAGPVSTVEDGRTVRCGSVIGAAAADPTPAVCHGPLTGRTELAAVLALACLAAGSAWAFAGGPPQPARIPMISHASDGAKPTR